MTHHSHNNERLRVGWLIDQPTALRLGPVLRPIIPCLHNGGIDVVLLSKGKNNVAQNPMADWGLEIFPCGPLPKLLHRNEALGNFAQNTKLANVQILHAMDDQSGALAGKISRQIDLPYIISCDQPKAGNRTWRQEPHLAGIIAAGQNVLTDLLKKKIVPENKLHIIRHSVQPAAKAKTLAPTSQCITILADATGANNGAVETMLNAFACLLNQEYDCSLFLLAAGKSERPLRQLAEKLEIQSQTNFIGSLPEKNIASVIQDSDMFVSLAATGDSNVHPLLAMACGVPLLAACGAKADCIQADETAVLFSPGDPQGLCKHIADMLDDPQKTHKLAAAALWHVAQNYDASHHAMKLAKIYKTAILPVEIAEPLAAVQD